MPYPLYAARRRFGDGLFYCRFASLPHFQNIYIFQLFSSKIDLKTSIASSVSAL